MSAAPIRWGIAGPGWIGGRMVEALRTLPDAEVVAVGSRSADRAAEFASRYGVPHAHGTYDDLFADADVDVVYLAGPHSTHRDQALAALAAGRHVVCEKAFALDAVQAREMVGAARGAGLFLMEAMWTWFLPPIVEICRRIAEGEIGRIRALRADFAIAVTGDQGRHRNPDLGGGALLDLGVYPVSLAHLLLGPPRQVVALGELGPTGVDTNLGAVLEHADGALTTMYTGLDAPSGMSAEIVGTEGLIRLDPPFWCTESFLVDRHDAPTTRVDMPHAGLAHEAAHAMDRIRAGELESDVISLDQSISVMETLDRIRAAMSDATHDDRG